MRMYDGDDKSFLEACKRADVKSTYRQWRKWCQSRGSAFSARQR